MHCTTSLIRHGYAYPASQLWEALLQKIGTLPVQVFSTIDHGANAHKAGIALPDTRVVTFGNPAVGSQLMLAAPDVALDLPLRVMVRATEVGSEVVYLSMEALAERHGLDPAMPEVQRMAGMLHKICAEL